MRDVFYNPGAFQAPQSAEQVTEAAAAEFSRLAEHLRRQGGPPERAAHFLIRLLFCLFAEDVDLLPEDVFSRLVTNARSKPEQFGAQLQLLFNAMSTGGWFGTTPISYFDGRLFDDAEVIPLGRPELDVLARVCDLDWGSIEPSIFGTLFERSLDPDKRSQLGAHYTSKEDILLIVEPVLMAPLRRRWEAVKAEAAGLARRRDEAATTRTRNNRQKELTALLTGFAGEVAAVQVLDPACGSGNFLYVALRQLLDLEKEIVTTAAQLGTSRFFPRCRRPNCTASRSTPTPTNWPRRPSGSVTFNGCGRTALAFAGADSQAAGHDFADGCDSDLRRAGTAGGARVAGGRRDHRQPAVPGSAKVTARVGRSVC